MTHDIDPQTACQDLDHNGTIYLDVRTEAEFRAGHVPGAYNVPIFTFDPARGMIANQDFPAVVDKVFPKDARIIVGCKSGQRSAQAADVLTRMGYRNLFNLRGGFAGEVDRLGRVIHPGWSGCGLPVSKAAAPGRSYAELKGDGGWAAGA